MTMMTPPTGPVSAPLTDDATLRREAMRVLRRLAEPGALLVVSAEMDRAAVLKGDVRIAVVDRAVAEAFAVKDWVAPDRLGRISTYRLSGTGRSALRRMLAEAGETALPLALWDADRGDGDRGAGDRGAGDRGAGDRGARDRADTAPAPGLAEAPSRFAGRGDPVSARNGAADTGIRVTGIRDTGIRDTGIRDTGIRDTGVPARNTRISLGESPVQVLARRRERDGAAFLPGDLVAAAERLREDFEIAQVGPRGMPNWDRLLQAGIADPDGTDLPGAAAPGAAPLGAAGRARDRVAAALRDLGPGLGDVVLRCCCYLEGLEAVETRMGWSARSGKVVLRIALARLKRHYDDTYGGRMPLIG